MQGVSQRQPGKYFWLCWKLLGTSMSLVVIQEGSWAVHQDANSATTEAGGGSEAHVHEHSQISQSSSSLLGVAAFPFGMNWTFTGTSPPWKRPASPETVSPCVRADLIMFFVDMPRATMK